MGSRLLRALGAAVLLSMFAGCTYSSQYVPKRQDRAAVMLEDDQVVIRHGTDRERLNPYGELGFGTRSAPRSEIFDCDDRALEYLEAAEENFATGQLWSTISFAYTMVWWITVPVYYLTIWPVVILGSIAQSYEEAGVANMIDALNRRNDAAACTEGAREAPRGKPDEAPPAPVEAPPPEPGEALPQPDELSLPDDASEPNSASSSAGKEAPQ